VAEAKVDERLKKLICIATLEKGNANGNAFFMQKLKCFTILHYARWNQPYIEVGARPTFPLVLNCCS
jgi:hypothetical protein